MEISEVSEGTTRTNVSGSGWLDFGKTLVGAYSDIRQAEAIAGAPRPMAPAPMVSPQNWFGGAPSPAGASSGQPTFAGQLGNFATSPMALIAGLVLAAGLAVALFRR